MIRLLGMVGCGVFLLSLCGLQGGCQSSDAEEAAARDRAIRQMEEEAARYRQAARQLETELAAATAERDEARHEAALLQSQIDALRADHQAVQDKLQAAEQALAAFEERLAQIPALVHELQLSIAKLQTLNQPQVDFAADANGLVPRIEHPK